MDEILRVAEAIVAQMFQVKGIEFIPKARLIKALAALSQAYESLYMDLFCENPLHARFAKIPEEQHKLMVAEAERRKAVVVQTKLAEDKKAARSAELTMPEQKFLATEPTK
jgi:hypothetical protein